MLIKFRVAIVIVGEKFAEVRPAVALLRFGLLVVFLPPIGSPKIAGQARSAA
jgi:hypothetical protein